MALQRVGNADAGLLCEIVRGWTGDRAYVQRAAIAAVSEPRLLKTREASRLRLISSISHGRPGTDARSSVGRVPDP